MCIRDRVCEYCENWGHQMKECYKYLGICAYCKKKGHIRAECRSYKSPQSSPTLERKIICPFCEGPHPGIRCTHRTPPRNNTSAPDTSKHRSPNEQVQGAIKKVYTRSSPQKPKPDSYASNAAGTTEKALPCSESLNY